MNYGVVRSATGSSLVYSFVWQPANIQTDAAS